MKKDKSGLLAVFFFFFLVDILTRIAGKKNLSNNFQIGLVLLVSEVAENSVE